MKNLEILQEALEFVNNHIDELVNDKNLDEDTKRVIRLRYGVDSGSTMNFKELRKTLRWSVAKMQRELTKAEKIVFNAIKKQI